MLVEESSPVNLGRLAGRQLVVFLEARRMQEACCRRVSVAEHCGPAGAHSYLPPAVCFRPRTAPDHDSAAQAPPNSVSFFAAARNAVAGLVGGGASILPGIGGVAALACGEAGPRDGGNTFRPAGGITLRGAAGGVACCLASVIHSAAFSAGFKFGFGGAVAERDVCCSRNFVSYCSRCLGSLKQLSASRSSSNKRCQTSTWSPGRTPRSLAV